MSLTRFRRVLGLAFASLALVASVAGAQQKASITGRVTDKESGAALQGVRLQIVGEQLFGISGPDGRYTIRDVSAGAKQVRAIFVGYDDERRSVTVSAGAPATLDFQLAAVPFSLDEIISTATGDQRRVELGHVVGSIKADSLVANGPVLNLGQLVQGRVAGVSVLPSSGTTGAGVRIRIRGNNSVSLSNEPLLFIDGVRADNSNGGNAAQTIGVGGQVQSRLNDLNPEEIENIEIIKGPSASTLYGPEAANGVIRVTTKKGQQGKPKWQLYGEGGGITDPNKYPDNYRNFGRNATNGTANYAIPAVPTTAQPFTNQTVEAFANGIRTIDTVTTFNPILNPATTPIGNGYRYQTGANVSGGNDQLQYFVSGEFENEIGTLKLNQNEITRLETSRGLAAGTLPFINIRPNDLRKVSLRSNIKAKVASNMDLTASIGYVTSNLRLPNNDNSVLGILSSGFISSKGAFAPATVVGPLGNQTTTVLGSTVPVGTGNDTVGSAGFRSFRQGELFSQRNSFNTDRLTATLNYNYNPASFLSLRANVGYDMTNRADNNFNPTGQGPNFGNILLGQINDNRIVIRQYTVDVGGTFNFTLSPKITSKTAFGAQFFRQSFNGNFAFGENLAVGQAVITGAATQTSAQTFSDRATFGQFVEQTFGFNDRLFINAAARRDDASAVGTNFSPQILPRFGGSYVLSDEEWFPKGGFITSLRLRGAWGKSTVLPGTTAAPYFVSPSTSTVQDNGTGVVAVQPGYTFGNIGNAALKPETSTETEFGFEAALLSDRVTVELTRFDKTTKDAIVARVLPPSVGANATQQINIGSVGNKGFELGVNIRAIQSKNLTWDIGASAATLSNIVNYLDTTIVASTTVNGVATTNYDCRTVQINPVQGCLAPILFGNSQRATPGYPAGAYFDRRIDFARSAAAAITRTGPGGTQYTVLPSDSIYLSSATGTAADTALQFLGNVLPGRTLDLTTTIGLFNGRVRISGLMSYQGDYKTYNLTEQFRCATQANCVAVRDPSASLTDQIRSVAARNGGSVRTVPAGTNPTGSAQQFIGGTLDGYIEDASFWRLREVSVTYAAPPSVARVFGGSSLSVTLAGRNLALFTNFTGLDPEVNEGNGNIAQRSFLAQPAVRTFLARVQVGF